MRIFEGGEGSGNFGHAGRPGQWGGSAKGYPQDSEMQKFVDGFANDEYYAKDYREYLVANKQNLTGLEEEALSQYTASAYLSINRYLRKPPQKGQRIFIVETWIDSMLDTQKPAEIDYTVYRGINRIVAQDLKIGDTLENKAFTSTTLDPKAAKTFSYDSDLRKIQDAAVIRFKIPKGHNIIYPNSWFEHEIILPPGAKLRITDISNKSIKDVDDFVLTYKVIEAELIN